MIAFLILLFVLAVAAAVVGDVVESARWRREKAERDARFQATLRSHTLERLYAANQPHATWMADDLKRRWREDEQ